MLISQKGFSPLLILIVATVVLVIISAGAYFFQNQKSNSTIIPVASIPPTPSPTVSSSSPEGSSPNPTASSSASLKPLVVSQVSQPDCTAVSCGQTTVLIISGQGFTRQTQLSATGQTNGNPYAGNLSQISDDGSQIYFDLLGIPCQTYTATITNPMPTGSSATFTFYPKKC